MKNLEVPTTDDKGGTSRSPIIISEKSSANMINPDVSHLERPKISEFEMASTPNNKSTQKSPKGKKSKMIDLEDIAPILEKLRKNVGEEPVNIRKEEEESKLSYDKMMRAVNENHARNTKGQHYGFGEACCDVETGYHCCCGTSKNTEFEKFGVGINLYFKFLKYLLVFFLLFMLLAVPSLYLSAEAAKSIPNFSISTYSNLLFASTIGTFGYDSFVCAQTILGSNQTITLDCGTDYILYNSSIYGLLAPADYISDGCFYTDISRVDTSCINNSEYNEFFNETCGNRTNCSFIPNASLFNSSAECTENLNTYYLYFNAYCANDYLDLSGGREIDKSYIPIIISFFDAGIILAYIFMLFSLSVSQKKTVNNVLHNSLSPALYTLEIMHLPRNMDKETLIVSLWKHMETVLNDAYKEHKKIFKIVDIQVAQKDKMMKFAYQKGELVRKRNAMIRKWATKYDTHRALPESVLFSHLKNFIVALEVEVQDKAKLELYYIEKVDLKVAKLDEKIQVAEKDRHIEFKAAWVTFETMRQRDLAYNYFFTTPLERCCFAICSESCVKNKKKLFMDKELKVTNAPDPSNINWLNLDSSQFSKFIRRLVSIIITLGLLIGTFALIAYIKIQQQDFLAQYPDVDCSLHTNVTKSDVEIDYSSKTRQGLAECYCKEDIQDRLDESFTVTIGGQVSQEKLCQMWLQKDVFTNLLPFLICIVIVSLNMIMQTLFKILSSFENHKYLSAELASRVIKIFVAQFLNTGIILLIINIRFEDGSNAAQKLQSIIKGRFYDFNPLWFEGVGTVVLLTMFINIFSTPLMVLFFHMLRLISRCIDQKCQCDRHVSRQKTQKKYENMYMGPDFLIDFRYSQVLTSVFVCFLYSAGLPFLYVTTFIQLLIIYWLDKIFILKVCKLPKNIDEQIEVYVKDILFFIVIAHLLFAIWIYGDSSVFPETITISYVENYQQDASNFLTENDFNSGYFDIFKTRVAKTQNIILLILLFLIVIYFIVALGLKFLSLIELHIFRILLWKPLKNLFAACCKKFSHKGYFSIKNKLGKMNYFKVMTKEQLKKEKILTKITLNEAGSKINPEYKQRLENKLKMIEEGFKIKTSSEFVNYKFIGLPSYDLRQNPTFKEMFAVDEFIS